MTKQIPFALTAALVTALFLPACGDKASPSTNSGASSAGKESEQASLDAALAQEPIPSQDVSDAAAEEAINQDNADKAYQDLKAEIDADG